MADHLTFQVFERGLESEPVGGEILFGVGGVNEFQVIIGVHRLSSCTKGSILGNPGVTHSVTLHSSVMKGVKWNASPLGKRGCTERDIERNEKVCQKFIGFISQ